MPGQLIGRRAERAQIGALLDRAAAGSGGMLWLEGDPGIGKSRMLADALVEAKHRGALALAADAYELGSHRPFGIIADCLGVTRHADDPARAALVQALYGRTGADGENRQPATGAMEFTVGELLLELIEALCARSPVLLALDDLQWADQSSLGFLARLVHEIPRLPLAVLGAARRNHDRAELDQVYAATAQSGACRRAIAPLSPDESMQLASELIGTAASGVPLPSVIARCGGNPLFVTMLIRGAQAEGSIADPDALRAVPSLRLAVISWLSFMRRETVEILGLASVLGATFTMSDLSLLTDRSSAALWPAVREALSAGVLVESGDRLEFRHDVVHESLYDDLPPTVRAGLHADFGRALAAAGAPMGSVAEHVLRGAQPGDRQAAQWLVAAAREAAPGGPKIAVELFEAALRLVDATAPERVAIETELATNLVACGRLLDAEQLCRTALDDAPDPSAHGALRLCLTDSLMRQGRLAEMLEQADLAASSPGLTEGERARALAWLIVGPRFARDVPATEAAARVALAAAESAGHTGAFVHAWTSLGFVAHVRGDFVAAEQASRIAVDAATRDGSTEAHDAIPHMGHSMNLADLDRFDEAQRAVDAGQRVYRRLGIEHALPIAMQFAGYTALRAGRWDDALAEYETATSFGARAGTGWQVDALMNRALIHARRGEFEQSEDLLARARSHIAAGAVAWSLGGLDWVDALLLEARGQDEAALAKLWRSWQVVADAPMRSEQRRFAQDVVRMLATAGDRTRLRAVAEAMLGLSALNPGLVSLQALAEQCAAHADGDDIALEAAVARYRGTARAHEQALAGEAAARAVARAGRTADAEALALEAIAGYEALGAEQDATRARAILPTAGQRPPVRPLRRAVTGWDALTASERRVAELAGQGLTNPEIATRLFVSRHTVATHVSHVLGKLGLRTRVELASELVRRNPFGGPAAEAGDVLDRL